ncbi:hypothetical protein [Acetobacter malorum]|nr:hypothetical protein [Acetobacter malorum]KFL88744.1 hypothetical protein AmDm5_2746 [Acetobacter malorum]
MTVDTAVDYSTATSLQPSWHCRAATISFVLDKIETHGEYRFSA